MAGKLIVDTIDTDNAFITLNVQQSLIATMNVSGIFSNTGVKMIGANGTVSNTAITGNITSSQITSVANTQITGNIISSQITSVANTQLTGLIQAAQIGSANATLVTSGTLPKARLPAGTVLQAVNTNYFTQTTTSGGTFVATGLSASITPSSTSSKILIFASGGDVASSVNNTGVAHALFRDSTNLVQFSNQGPVYTGNAGNTWIGTGPSVNYLDSPSTTSAITYAIYFRPQSAGPTATVQRDSTSSTMTLLEIAG